MSSLNMIGMLSCNAGFGSSSIGMFRSSSIGMLVFVQFKFDGKFGCKFGLFL